jgi:hypothetical protein
MHPHHLQGFVSIYLAKGIKTITVTKGNGKAIPLQAWTGSEGSRRLRLLDFKTICT